MLTKSRLLRVITFINGQTIDNNNNIHYNDTLLGMMSYQQEQNQVDGEKSIMLNPNEQQRRDYKEQVLEAGEVYCIDMIMSTGDGKVINNEYNSKVYNCILIRCIIGSSIRIAYYHLQKDRQQLPA